MNGFSILRLAGVLSLIAGLSGPAMAQESFSLTSPALTDGAPLPADMKCSRDGGDGLSPPVSWTNSPAGTQGFAIIMHHYPKGRTEGVDAPSQYWLLWNIPASTTGIPRGNPASLGDEGSDKDMHGTGYTPPCAPPGPSEGPPHRYTITVYALSAPLATLPAHDDGAVNWEQMVAAMDGLVLGSSSISFTN